MFKTTMRMLVAIVMTVSVAAPSAAVADFHFVRYIDKSSPTIYQGGGSTTQPTQPAPPAK